MLGVGESLTPRGEVTVRVTCDDGTVPRVHGDRAHRHARGAGRVPPRRHPAVRAAPAGEGVAGTVRGSMRDRRASVSTRREIKRQAAAAGFDLCGIAPAADRFPSCGSCASGSIAATPARWTTCIASADRRADVRARAAVGALGHRPRHRLQHRRARTRPSAPIPRRAAIARYAWGDDYHVVIEARLERCSSGCARASATRFEARAYVDTGPVQERVYAQYAGLGWIGKNTCLINPELGSWIFLSEIICNLALEPDAPASISAGPARCASTRARPARWSSRRARLDALPLVSDDRAQGRHSRGAARRRSASTCTAATSARRSVRGT